MILECCAAGVKDQWEQILLHKPYRHEQLPDKLRGK
jgi:hypothetical protein